MESSSLYQGSSESDNERLTTISGALRQAFMPNQEYENVPEEDRACEKIQKPLAVILASAVVLVVVICVLICYRIVFPRDIGRRPFCSVPKILPVTTESGRYSDFYPDAFYLTDEETEDYFWIVVFIPSSIVFFSSVLYLVAGMIVAYNAPSRHGCLQVVENNCCASKRGGVRCLSVLNLVFGSVLGVLAVFLGSSLLTLGGRCATPLFWSYEIAAWGMVILYVGTAFSLRRKGALVVDDGGYGGRSYGIEMREHRIVITPELERRVNHGFKSWMVPSDISSEEEDYEF